MSYAIRLLIACAFLLPVISHLVVFNVHGEGARQFENPIVLLFQSALSLAPFLVVAIVNTCATRLRGALAMGFGLMLTFWVWQTVEGIGALNTALTPIKLTLDRIMLLVPLSLGIFMAVFAGPSPTRRNFERD